ncbi:hypothetical protein AYI69_g2031 [Smittium culicis]|uniref:Fibronectin type-III domain-containing protein n=1 Tax=Smittium culicis TaxID=133412 RepID=A0A1R1YNN8_9FUNG|nr:hypothetical protein AYI69_g2031 [Smittium culicis]
MFYSKILNWLFRAGGRWWMLTLIFAVLNIHSQFFKWFPLSLQLLVSSHYTALILLRTVFFSSNILGSNEFTIEVTDNHESLHNLALVLNHVSSNTVVISWGFEYKKKFGHKSNRSGSLTSEGFPSRHKNKKNFPQVSVNKFLVELNNELIGECSQNETNTAISGLLPDSVYRIQIHALIESTKSVQISSVLIAKTHTDTDINQNPNQPLLENKTEANSPKNKSQSNDINPKTSLQKAKTLLKKANFLSRSNSKNKKNTAKNFNSDSNTKSFGISLSQHNPSTDNERAGQSKLPNDHPSLSESKCEDNFAEFSESQSSSHTNSRSVSYDELTMQEKDIPTLLLPDIINPVKSRTNSFNSDSTCEKLDFIELLQYSKTKEYTNDLFISSQKNESDSITTEVNVDYFNEESLKGKVESIDISPREYFTENESLESITETVSTDDPKYEQPEKSFVNLPTEILSPDKNCEWTVQTPKKHKKKAVLSSINNQLPQVASHESKLQLNLPDHSNKYPLNRSKKLKQSIKPLTRETQTISNKYLDNMSYENFQKSPIYPSTNCIANETTSFVDPKLNYKDVLLMSPNNIKAVKKSADPDHVEPVDLDLDSNNLIKKTDSKNCDTSLIIKKTDIESVKTNLESKKLPQPQTIDKNSTKLYNGANSTAPIIVKDLQNKIKNSKAKNQADSKKNFPKKFRKNQPSSQPTSSNTNFLKSTPENSTKKISILSSNKYTQPDLNSRPNDSLSGLKSTELTSGNLTIRAPFDLSYKPLSRPTNSIVIPQDKREYPNYNIFGSIPSFNARTPLKQPTDFDYNLNNGNKMDSNFCGPESLLDQSYNDRNLMLLDFEARKSKAINQNMALSSLNHTNYNRVDPNFQLGNPIYPNNDSGSQFNPEYNSNYSYLGSSLDRNIQNQSFQRNRGSVSGMHPSRSSFSNYSNNFCSTFIPPKNDILSDNSLVNFPSLYSDWNSFAPKKDGLSDNCRIPAQFPFNHMNDNSRIPPVSVDNNLSCDTSNLGGKMGFNETLSSRNYQQEKDNLLTSNDFYSQPDFIRQNYQKDLMKSFSLNTQLWNSPSLSPSTSGFSFNAFQQPSKFISPPRVSPIGYRPNLPLKHENNNTDETHNPPKR